ncbi:arsenite oxidase small subunit [Burkholderia ubonensis]|uniref:Arsenite oxidase small subunit n=1 Tax=Burkholderia ubonensis TaxID=101571 RepID=A0AB73FSK3_9BURK|nr:MULTISPECIES: arsenate reductase (azurin) small subunit [Burkholderia]KGU73800.1 arsenite oxidase, small subunit [Burkholderia pseudomallei MSHR4304]KGV29771.1 arsenite oxidase, small subunit [Burkholderia pseudomallei MSHR4308]KGW06596.1 arsenite oxidase, small subunit [Burkholderia pseudomallei MSHR4303]KVK87737.1 arsenite oxidase small subunit [Burkholderia ubonensis]KVL66264.1 arsenite oxidase small subunit [Burkholderia ubonensis]
MSLSRRHFLKLTGGAAAGATVTVAGTQAAQTTQTTRADAGRVTLPYTPKVIAHAAQLRENAPLAFTFPDASSPCVVVKMGAPVLGGVGPGRDIVAFSVLCTHMGCPVAYDAATRAFNCPCHFSKFDAEKAGQMISGQATEKLPSIVLDYNASNGTVRAIAVDGLIYGRQANLL